MTSFQLNRCEIGDCREVLRTLPDAVFHCCVTSPPYWGLRDYGHNDQIGLESTPDEYVSELVNVFREVRRVMRPDGTLWLNLGDSYAMSGCGADLDRRLRSSTLEDSRRNREAAHGAKLAIGRSRPDGFKNKDLIGLPWRVALALQADGWWLRSDIIWHKPNPMPESVRDRPSRAHEYVFLLARSERYYYDAAAIAERALQPVGDAALTGQRKRAVLQDVASSTLGTNAGSEYRNARTVWSIVPQPYSGAHLAVMPPSLIERCIMAGCPDGGAVIDPFFGSGTVGQVAERLGRRWFGIELNPDYKKLIDGRTAQTGMRFVP